MSGNVWEWCLDYYDKEYYKKSPISNPKGPKCGEVHVARGGSWVDSEHSVTCYHRCKSLVDSQYYTHNFYEDMKSETIGFRIVFPVKHESKSKIQVETNSCFEIWEEFIIDKATKLMWVRNVDLFNFLMTKSEALENILNLKLCGFSDWRIPIIEDFKMLSELVGEEKKYKDLRELGFEGNLNRKYWSSSNEIRTENDFLKEKVQKKIDLVYNLCLYGGRSDVHVYGQDDYKFGLLPVRDIGG